MSELKSGGKALILIVNALFWAAAILGGSYFFKGETWGTDSFLWMIVGFTVSNGLLMAVLRMK